MEEMKERERVQMNNGLLLEALKTENLDQFRTEFLEMHPYDQAQFYTSLSDEFRSVVYRYLSPEEMAGLFENIEIDKEDFESLLAEMNPSYVADMLSHMYADDAADVLNEINDEQAVSYLTIMDDEAASEIQELLNYEEYTAGSIMTTEFIAIEANETARSAMKILKREAPQAETIYYVFVTDQDKKLLGVLSLRTLIIADEDALIGDLMDDRVVSVPVSEDQEEVARKIRDYNFLAVPVVDFQNHLLGIITVDDIIDVMDEEASDDYSKLAGVPDLDHVDKSPFSAAKKRLPWLIILLFLGLLTASLIGRFEETLSQKAILAVFIPLIGGMAGNTGTQALAVAVRGIATGELEQASKWKLVIREAGTGLITGLTCGTAIVFIVYIWQGDLMLGLLVGISIFITLIVATLAGSLVPLLMHKMKIDPAVASGPFITTINDIISVLIYFGLATLFMGYLL
ncbi:magnesium transporter [Peribacillus simplex]|uniref:Magnesium transporter MgtE n=2 Tax=Peribacillus simplex TaxID=1478 RepID=A0AAW7IGX8_9BACI|nr:magnesium transporter [Peribacillus simplex]MDM5454805.1 magnesium transporter [Peribacillus simplex]